MTPYDAARLQSAAAPGPLVILRRKQVTERTGLPTSTLYALMSRSEFPRPVRLGAKAVGWRSDHIEAWIASRQQAVQQRSNGQH